MAKGLLSDDWRIVRDNPFWMKRAMGRSESDLANKAYLTNERGDPQTIYSMTAPTRDGGAMMYPSIRWRSPGFLERLGGDQAYDEAMRKQDYLKFDEIMAPYKSVIDTATGFAMNFSPTIKRGMLSE